MSPPAPAPAIEVRDVTKEFVIDWRGTRRRALERVSFSVAPGTVCALVGPNGSGKTTLLKICAGLTAATSGTCRLLGTSPARAGRAGRLGYVADELALPGYFTARDVLVRLARVAGADAARAAREAEAALAQTGLAGEAERRVREFSRGMRQRLALAVTLLGDPAVLLLDEPAAGLDPRALLEFAAFVRAGRAAGRTILLSSHFLPQVEELADQFVVLDAGRRVYDGPRAELAARGGLSAIYLEAVRA